MAALTRAFPDREFSGIGGISSFDQALSYFMLGCGTVQVATAAMLDHAIGPNVIASLKAGMTEFLERNAERGWTSLEDFRGMLRGRIVPHSQIARPDARLPRRLRGGRGGGLRAPAGQRVGGSSSGIAPSSVSGTGSLGSPLGSDGGSPSRMPYHATSCQAPCFQPTRR